MKRFALFLPQFHEIEENNKWWGKGFTEWTHVKNAIPLYDGHDQPKKPLDENYYNLLDKQTVIKQTNLANEYGIDGFVYYHYFFSGKRIMEKPAENLLKWKDIPQKFFFCWANHTWYKAVDGKKQVLIEQKYGDENVWEEHFNYLLPFFKDDRYEKKDNKPLFMIFNSDFKEKKEIFTYFEKRCKESGFNGIYLIETYMGDCYNDTVQKYANSTIPQTEMLYIREPAGALRLFYGREYTFKWFVKRAIQFIKKKRAVHDKSLVIKYDGSKLVRLMAKNEKYTIVGKKIAHGLFFEWDNTPRHSSRGYIITPVDEKSMEQYYECIKDDEYVFINAWNEWAEGMILEPTEKDGYRNLEMMKKIFG